MNTKTRSSAALRLCTSLFFLVSSLTFAAPKPNFVLIFIDDMGYGDIGPFGNTVNQTPNLDRMAAEGLVLRQFYVSNTACTPSRSALMTGSYAHRIGMVGKVVFPGENRGLNPDEITIAELLQEQGYATGCFGKWHLGDQPEFLPPAQGFDKYFGIPYSNDMWPGNTRGNPLRDRGPYTPLPVVHQDKAVAYVSDGADQSLLCEFITDRTIEFIKAHRDEPFFAYVPHTYVHGPRYARPEILAKADGNLARANIEEVDTSVGRILDTLRELGLAESTLVLFTSDNGGTGGTSMGPLRGGKSGPKYEGNMRTPTLTWWPGTIPAGRETNEIVASIDLLPSIATLAGTAAPADRTIDGKNAVDVLLGKPGAKSPHPILYYGRGGIRQGKWKLVRTGSQGKATAELYDLAVDIGEQNNIAAQHPDRVKELNALLDAHTTEVAADTRPAGSVEDARPIILAPGDLPRLREFMGKPDTIAANETIPRAPGKLPNIVLIFADDLGYGDLSCYGATKLQTPNIDKLAAGGRRFTDAHSASAVCTPSRFALLTGQYPIRANGGKGIWGPLGTTSKLLIDVEQATIAKVLKRKGYDTSCFGKWHLGFGNGNVDWSGSLRPGPQDVGFDYYFGVPVVNSYPPYVYVENDRIYGLADDDPMVSHRGEPQPIPNATPITPLKREHGARRPNFFSGATEAHKLYNDFTVGTTLAQRACAWIEERDNPFFLYLPTTNVHHPCTAAPRFQGTSQCGLYGDYVHELDWMVGEVMKALEKKGVADNTLVIFTSDNGGMFNENGQDAFTYGHRNNGDLLGYKFGVWEGGHRVPFIARWPGRIKPGSESDQLICHVDMLASFAALTGQILLDVERGDSVNVLPALTGQPKQALRKELILAPAKSSHLGLRRGKWMFIDAQGSGGFSGTTPGGHGFAGAAAASFSGHPNSDIVDGTIKEDAPPAQLYNLVADVNQTRNLYNDYPEVVKEMRQRLQDFRAGAHRQAQANERQNAAPKIPATPSGRSAAFDFESGQLAPWKVIEGALGHPVSSRETFLQGTTAYNKQGMYYLTTLETSETAQSGSDAQTGVIVSPFFIPQAGAMTFRVGGGTGDSVYVALCMEDGTEVRQARGINSQVMQKANWKLTPYAGKKMYIKIVDQSTGGWGHITVDHFQFDAELLEQYPETIEE